MAIKYSFSTLGCPEWSWNDIFSMAKDLGYSGIEVRGLGNEIYATKAKPFTDAEISNTVNKLASANIEIICFSSSCCLKYEDKLDENMKEVREYIDLAKKVGSKYVRVLADIKPGPEGEVDDEKVLAQLLKILPYAQENNIIILLETNGVYADSKRLAALIEKANSPFVAALWDVHHTYRFFNEQPADTWAYLGKYIKHVHLKDSVDKDDKIVYKLPGEGDIPLAETLKVLTSNGFDGFVCLEWVKRWASEIEDAAIAFPKFANFMKEFIATSKEDKKEQDACDEKVVYEKGSQMFEKDILVDYTFGGLLHKVAREYPNQYAFKYTTRDYTRTYAEFDAEVTKVAKMFLKMGVKKGTHVAIWATNYPEWFLTFWAATRIGAVLVTVNTSYKIHEAEYLLKQSDTHTLVMIDGYKDSNYVEIINEICPELADSMPGQLEAKRLPRLKNVVTVDSRQKGCFYWENAIEMGDDIDDSVVEDIEKTLDVHEVCNMQYTSGTTGFPKGVMLTHYGVVNNGKCIGDCMDLSTADRMLIQVPMFHCFGMVLAMTASVTHGVTMVPIEAFSPRTALAAINKEKITAMHGVPTMFIALLENENFEKTDFSYMRTGIMAGSPCPIAVMRDVVDKMNMRDITIVFGQTESSPGCTQSRVGDSLETRVATVGRALPGVECKIVDPETNEELPDNVDGEFVARGYNIMKGYYNMPEATAAAIDEDGWLHTGDLARRTPEGNYKITGRIKDMIIRGGENIYPKEIEEFLYTHDMVKDVQVIGVPDKTYGEEIMACIILKDECIGAIDEDGMKKYVLDHMAKHKVPKYIKFVDSFPMNAAGKILKYKMREWAVEELNLKADSEIEMA